MSYNTWHDYGYGICTDNLREEVSLDRLMKLVKTAPKLYERVQKYAKGNCRGEIAETCDLLIDFVENYGEIEYGGLAEILYEVIKECEGIELLVSEDFEGRNYLIYPPVYPWVLAGLSDKEKNLTKESLSEIFSKYLAIVTDENIPIEYQSVENGG